MCAVLLTTRDTLPDAVIHPALRFFGEVLVRRPRYTERYPDGRRWIHDDSRIYGRWEAERYTGLPVLYYQDDDVVFINYEELLDAYEPGRLVANMDRPWVEAQHYYDLALCGFGSIADRGLGMGALRRYRSAYGKDERFLIDADFIVGVLAPTTVVSLGGEVLGCATDPERLSMQPGQMEGKWATIRRARALRTVVLAVMARDEEQGIVRMLDSAKGWADSVLLQDTGSLDRTVGVTRRWCADNGMPLSVMHRAFSSFKENRQLLLEAARQQGDYILLMDADETLAFTGPLGRPDLLCDAYFLHYAGEFDYAQPRLIRSWFPWYWDGSAHACLDSDRPAVCLDLRSPQIVHHGDGRHGDTKVKRDIELLSADIEAGKDVPRSLFLRGKAYMGTAQWDRAQADLEARVQLSEGDEEAYYARFLLGVLLVEQRGDLAGGADHLMTAWLERPTRVESIRALAHYLTSVADSTPYPVEDKIIVHRGQYKQTA